MCSGNLDSFSTFRFLPQCQSILSNRDLVVVHIPVLDMGREALVRRRAINIIAFAQYIFQCQRLISYLKPLMGGKLPIPFDDLSYEQENTHSKTILVTSTDVQNNITGDSGSVLLNSAFLEQLVERPSLQNANS